VHVRIYAIGAVSLAVTIAPSFADPSPGLTAVCASCHGLAGQSTQPEIPSLGGQPALYAMFQLFLFREGRRTPGPMTELAKQFTDDDLRSLSEAISKWAPPQPPIVTPDSTRFDKGRVLAARHHCGICHNADFSGHDQIPRLANQREDYLLKALREFKSGARIGFRGAMAEEVVPLKDDDFVDLSHFLAYLPTKQSMPAPDAKDAASSGKANSPTLPSSQKTGQ
jgi:cytochrome c553